MSITYGIVWLMAVAFIAIAVIESEQDGMD